MLIMDILKNIFRLIQMYLIWNTYFNVFKNNTPKYPKNFFISAFFLNQEI